MKKIAKVLAIIIEVIIIAYVIIVTACLLNKNKFGYTVFNNSTLVTINNENLNELKSFKNGDLILIEKVGFNDVKVGDSIYYYDSVNQEYILKIGVVTEKTGDNRSYVYKLKDSKTISNDKVVGQYEEQKYSNVGKVLDVLESKFGFLLLVILPVFILFIYQVYKMIVLLKEEPSKK